MGTKIRGTRAMPGAIIASLLAHASLVPLVNLHATGASAAATAPPEDLPDLWAGTTSALPSERLYEIAVDGASGHGAPAPPPASKVEPPVEKVAAPTIETPKPAPVEKVAAPTIDAPRPAPVEKVAAPTIDAPRPAPVEKVAAPTIDADAAREADEPATAPRPARKPARSASPRVAKAPAAPDAAPSAGGEASGSGTFGAEGPGGARDLGRAFTRAIPPACQADTAWAALPVGDAGSFEVSIRIGESGRVEGFDPEKADPPAHLVALVKRTLALLGAGTFAIGSGAVTAGAQVLRVAATVSDDGSEAEGGVAGLSFTYAGKRGKAAFTQAGGRHVEITVEVIRVVVAASPAPGPP